MQIMIILIILIILIAEWELDTKTVGWEVLGLLCSGLARVAER